MKAFLLSLCCLSTLLSKAQIDSNVFVPIQKIDQYIEIKGENKNLPILLFLHGGPGRSLIKVAPSFTDQLVKHFIVIQWDQRETGKTKEKNSTVQPLTKELLEQDALQMTQYLLRAFNRKKLYLVSHSWGSVPGFFIADTHPELLHAYIPISAIVNQTEHSQLTVSMLKKWAKKINNTGALEELDKINIPLQTEEDLFYQQKWLFIHNGADFATKPGFKDEYYDWMDTWFPLCIRATDSSLTQTISKINCPIYFIEGNGDKQKSHQLVMDYYKQLKAETKDFYWFTESGHTVFNTEPEKLQASIIEIANKQAGKTQ